MKIGQSDEVQSCEYIPLAYHDHILVNLLRNHTAGDFCIIGPSACGKSIIAKKFAELLNYEIEPVVLYQVCSLLLLIIFRFMINVHIVSISVSRI